MKARFLDQNISNVGWCKCCVCVGRTVSAAVCNPLLSEYEVVSTTKGPNGEEVSILTTNQTHTAVENLNPESRYGRHGGCKSSGSVRCSAFNVIFRLCSDSYKMDKVTEKLWVEWVTEVFN